MSRKPKKFLPETHPHLLEEWDYEKNALNPEDVSKGSEKKIYWKCEEEHSWKARVHNRAKKIKPRGCPICAGNMRRTLEYVTEKFNSLGLSLLADAYINFKVKMPYECRVCSYTGSKSFAVVDKGQGCPKCANKRASVARRLDIVHARGEFLKHGLCLLDVEYVGAREKMLYRCLTCNYVGERSLNSVKCGSSCAACSNWEVWEGNCLLTTHPEISAEWDEDRNGYPSKEVTAGAHKKVWWKCKKCRYGWKTLITHRTHNKSNCPRCAKGPVSKVSQKWLDGLEVGIREHYISELRLTVDGFDPKTNTIYEFLGDYWHGNPKIYSASKINTTNKKPFGALFKETQDRIKLLEVSGYNVIYIWENDFNREVKNGNVST